MDVTGLAADTEVGVSLNAQLIRQSAFGRAWLQRLMDMHSWQMGGVTSADAMPSKQLLAVNLQIGDFPKMGVRQRDARGTDVYQVPNGVSITTYSHRRALLTNAAVRAVIVTTNASCSSVTTQRKRALDAAPGGLTVFNPRTGELSSRPVYECTGYLVPYVRQESIDGTDYCRDLGWWYGVLVADGWLEPSMIGYAKNDSTKRKEFERIAREFIYRDFTSNEYFDDGSSPGKFAQSAKVHLFSPHLRKAVLDCYCPRGDGRGALYKRIPTELLSHGSRDCLLGLLAGLLEGDSSLRWSYSKKRPQAVCRCNTSSWCLVQDLIRLGRKLGMRSSITTTPPKGPSNESYAVNWSLPDVFAILHELQFVGKEARQWQTEFLGAPPTKDDIDIVPITKRLAEHLTTLLLRRGEINLYDTCRQAHHSFSLTRRAANRVLQLTADAADHPDLPVFKITTLATAMHWDRVKHAFDAGVQPVFGLSVDGLDGFMVQNGLIVPSAVSWPSRATSLPSAQQRSGSDPSRNYRNTDKSQCGS